MNKTEWSHLLNASHIDWVISSVKTHPEKWNAAWDAGLDTARGAALGAALSATWTAALGAALSATWTAATDAALSAAWAPARGVIGALVAWDHSAKYLSMTPDELRVWYALSDDPACILLLPAVMVLQEEKELVC